MWKIARIYEPKFLLFLMQIAALIVINNYNFNLCGFFEKMISFSPILNPDLEQGKLMAAIHSRK